MEEDNEMKNNNNIISINDNSNNKPNIKQNEDSSSVLDDFENELKVLNNTFLDSLLRIRELAPFLEKGNKTNMEKTDFNPYRINIPNYDEQRNNFDNMVNDYGNQMNEHFDKLLNLTDKLKEFEEFKTKEDDLKRKLDQLKQKNINSNKKMEEKLQTKEKIFNDLNIDNSMP